MMSPSAKIFDVRFFVRMILLALASKALWAADYANRPVQSVLEELRSQGLTIIYSNDTVPPTLRVAAEPKARGGVELAREILSGHALTLREVAPGFYVVVAAPAARRSESFAAAPQAPLDEVVVQSSRYTVAGDGASHAFFSQEQVKNLPRLADEPLRAVQRLPGSASNGYSSLSFVRGGEANETAIELDGLRLHEPFHLRDFMSPVSLLDARWIRDIDYYSGGFPVRYGDRMSAVIDVQSIELDRPRYYEASLTLFHLSALADGEWNDGRGNFLVSGRRSNADFLSQFSENDIGEPNYYDAFAHARYRLSETLRGSLEALVSGDNVHVFRDEESQAARVANRNTYVWATLEKEWSESARNRLMASYSEVSDTRNGEVREPGRRTASVSDRRFLRIGALKMDGVWQSEANGIMRMVSSSYGIELQDLQAEYKYDAVRHFASGYPFPASSASELNRSERLGPHGYAASAYGDARWQLGARWVAQVGLRFDRQTYGEPRDADQWSPRASLLYRAGAHTDIRASWGRYYQAQGIDELQVEDGVTRYFDASRADQMILSLTHSFAVGEFRIEAYRKDYRNPRPRFENLFNPLQLLPEIEFDRVELLPRGARSEGGEVLFRFPSDRPWSGWISYAWSRAFDRFDDRSELRSWDQTHSVNLGVSWAQGPWLVTVADHFHTGWPITTLSATGGGTMPVVVQLGRRNAARLDDYNSLDLRIARTFALKHGVLEAFVEASNALSERNACCVDYTIAQDAKGAPIVEKEVDNWLPLVPSAGILWRY